MTKDQESGGAPLEQLPDEALCRLIREQDRPAEELSLIHISEPTRP